LVLGATGHIGAHVVRALLAEGYPVRAAYRREQYLSVLDGLPVERVQVDVRRADDLANALRDCEWVFHAAGYYPRFGANRCAAIREGLDSIRRTLDVLQRAKLSRIVFTSSAATIRRLQDRPATEADAEVWPLRAWRPLYATVKIAMEHEVLGAARAGLPVVIVNPSICLGEYDAHPFSGQLILAYAKHRLPVYVHHQFGAIYTGDVGIGQVRAAQRGRAGERYLLTTRNLTLQEMAAIIAHAAGVPPPRWRIPYGAAWTAAVISEALAWVTRTEPLLHRDTVHAARQRQWLDGSKAVRELGLPHTPIEDAVGRALQWFRRRGMC